MHRLKKLPLAGQIFIALVLAIITGLLLQDHAGFAKTYISPFGTIFLNLLKFIVVPIVLFSIMGGVISMKDIRKVGKIGGASVLYYTATTACATTIGLFIANLFKGFFPKLSTTALTYKVTKAPSLMDTFVNIFPSNFVQPLVDANMLQVIFMALLIGFAIILVGEKAEPAIKAVNVINEIMMKCMEMILKLSPIGVFCLLSPVIAENGAVVIGSLAKVLLCAYICFIIHAVVVYSSAVRAAGGLSPLEFFKGMMPAILFAFSSASSIGTLPLNMGVCAIFIASCYGINLTFGQMVTIVITATLASIGTAGVPGSGMVMLAMVLQSVGLPVAGVALVAGVDRIFDMGRTTLNITGDASCALVVSHLQAKRAAKRAKKAKSEVAYADR